VQNIGKLPACRNAIWFSGSFRHYLLDARAAKQRADKSSAVAEPKASLLDELSGANVPER